MLYKLRYLLFLFVGGIIIPVCTLSGQTPFENLETWTYIKRELNTGIKFYLIPEKEELRTDNTLFAFDQIISAAAIEIVNNSMIYLPSRQEKWSYHIELGSFLGKGNLADSSATEYIDANYSPSGYRGKLRAAYVNRFYWDSKNYTIVSVNGWGQYDLFRRNAKGTTIDSNNVVLPYNDGSVHSKLRYGFQAKAGWGIGRLNPVNHIAASQWLLEKHYFGRNFSEEEIRAVAREIGRVKHQRNPGTGHTAVNETRQLAQFINSRLLLEPPVSMESDWELTEFKPRFHGSRLEFGPFFNYFNREPDFVYGGYFRYENHKYCRLKLNRLIKAGISYNSYKRDDWITFEATSGWNWYPALKHEIGFGIRYLPGMIIKGRDKLEPLRHAVIPYLEYFSQLNSKYRIDAAFAYRIACKEEFVSPGPELSVSIYRSRY